MKRILLIVIMAVGAYGVSNAQKGKTPATKAEDKIEIVADGMPKIKFAELSHDFGNIKEGTQATYEFKFTNAGTAPLVLENVQASCGCTTPEWTKESIEPGKTGKVIATFNSSGRPGTFTKTITVTYNGAADSKTEYLTIKGFVESAPVVPQTPVAVPENK